MQNFTKRINSELGYSPEFFFNRIYTVNGLRYHVSVMDRARQPHYFNMEQKGDHWKIINAPKVEDWIMKLEKDLETAIFENLVG